MKSYRITQDHRKMIDKDLWTEEEIKIFAEFGYKCLDCLVNDAVTLHELVPKSLAPKTWNTPENRVPLCNDCHRKAHSIGTKNSRKLLELKRYGLRKFG